MVKSKSVTTAAGSIVLLVLGAVIYFTQPASEARSIPAIPVAQPNTASPGARPMTSADGARPAVVSGDADPANVRFGIKAPRPKTPGTVRLTSFNIENLFDDHDDPALTGSGDDKDMTKPSEAQRAAADAIRSINPDILCLQEVESEKALRWFLDRHLSDMGYTHVVSVDAGDPRGIEQSVVSRFPIKDVKTYVRKKLGGVQPKEWGRQENREAGQEFEFKRTPLQVTVTIPSRSVDELLKKAGKADPRAADYELTIFNVHLKSGRDYDLQRGAEAGGIVELIKGIEKNKPGANVLVVGDFNATLNQPALQVFNAAGIESIFNDRNPRDAATMTHTTGRCIDHIYFTRNSRPELLMESKFVLGMPARPEGADWRTTPAPAGYASDHYPVSIDLRPIEGR